MKPSKEQMIGLVRESTRYNAVMDEALIKAIESADNGELVAEQEIQLETSKAFLAYILEQMTAQDLVKAIQATERLMNILPQRRGLLKSILMVKVMGHGAEILDEEEKQANAANN